jgi:hypothetical protein
MDVGPYDSVGKFVPTYISVGNTFFLLKRLFSSN